MKKGSFSGAWRRHRGLGNKGTCRTRRAALLGRRLGLGVEERRGRLSLVVSGSSGLRTSADSSLLFTLHFQHNSTVWTVHEEEMKVQSFQCTKPPF